MPFSAKSLDFLVENRLNDSKVWYNEHKSIYTENITKPFIALLEALKPTMLKIDNEIICEPKCISRIYRDTRFSKDKSLFREHIWCTLGRRKLDLMPPSFYFDISPSGMEYGCGYYQATTAAMTVFRKLILDGDKDFSAARKAVEKQSTFEPYGDLYKKNRYPEQDAELSLWLNRKNIGLTCSSKDFDLLFGDTDKLAAKLAADFLSIAPFYTFLIKTEELSKRKE